MPITTTYTALLNFGPELLRRISEFLDKRSLRAFTLICQQWYLASRPVVFRKITVKTDEKYQRVLNLLKHHSQVRPWVKLLRLEKADDEDDLASPSSNDDFVKAFALELAPLLSKLERLEFAWLDEFDPQNVSSLLRGLSLLTTVHTLCLSNCMLTGDFVLSLARAFPTLTSLHILGFSIPFHYEPPLPEPKSYPLQLRCLKYHEEDELICHDEVLISTLHQAIASSPSKDTLCSLDFAFMDRLSLSHISMLLKTVGPSLEELTLKLPMSLKIWGKDRGYAEFKRCLSLDTLTNLRELRMDEIKHPATLDILATLPDPIPLRRLTFRVEFNNISSISNKAYAPLDEFLASARFLNTTQIWFEYKGILSNEQVQGKLQRVFKRVYAKNVLGVSKVTKEYYYGSDSDPDLDYLGADYALFEFD